MTTRELTSIVMKSIEKLAAEMLATILVAAVCVWTIYAHENDEQTK